MERPFLGSRWLREGFPAFPTGTGQPDGDRKRPVRGRHRSFTVIPAFPLLPASYFPAVPSNSSPIHFWNAFMFWGRPRKFFTMSFADSVPPGSSTVRR